jgi:chromate transporter
MIYLQLFLSFLQIGAFSFGGGYAAMPLIQNQVVQLHPWLSQSEFTDLITISQMTPGPIAVNSATFVGTRIAGVPGALAATIGCVLPSCILVTILAKIYLKYRNLSLLQDILKSLRPAVIAMIAAAGVSILVTAFWGNDISSLHLDTILSSTNIRAVGIFLVSLILLAKFKMDPIHVMLLSGGGSCHAAHYEASVNIFSVS